MIKQSDSTTTLITGVILDNKTDRPIPGVQVTNGESIVISNSDGQYQISCEQQHRFIQLALPNGYYGEWFSRIDHTVKNMDLHFPLTPTPKTVDTCNFVQITDTHLIDDAPPLSEQSGPTRIGQTMLQADIDYIAAKEKPDFIIATGDLTNVGSDSQLSRLKTILQRCKVPVFPGFGGHDGLDTGEARRSVEKWEKHIGPAYFSWNAGGRHFIFAINEEGYLHDEQLEMHDRWLKNDLQKNSDREVIFATHAPPTDELLTFLTPYKVSFFIYGHWHANKVYKHYKMVICCTPPLVYAGDERTPRSYRKFNLPKNGSCSMDLVSVVNTEMRVGVHPQSGKFLNEKWHLTLPSAINSTFLSFASDGDKELICFPFTDLSRTSHQELVAIEADSGREYWRTKVPADIHSALTIANNTVYAQTIPGQVSAHSLTNGQSLWTTDLIHSPHRFLYTAPVYHNGIIFAGSKGGFAALDARTGEVLWQHDLYTYDTWACYAHATIYKNLVIVYIQASGLQAFEQKTGKTVWEFKEPYGNLLHFGQATPVICNDTLITGTKNGKLLGIDLNTGKISRERVCSSSFVAGISIVDDILQIAFADGVVGEWNSRTFDNYWTLNLPANAALGILDYVRGGAQGLIAPLRYKDRRLAFDLIDTIFLLNEQGKRLDQYKLNSPVVTPPVIKADKLWVSCLHGRIAHFELKI